MKRLGTGDVKNQLVSEEISAFEKMASSSVKEGEGAHEFRTTQLGVGVVDRSRFWTMRFDLLGAHLRTPS